MLCQFIGMFYQKKEPVIFKNTHALIKPVLKLLKNYQITIIGDREFQSRELATWLRKEQKRRKQKFDFAFREKQDTFFHKGGKKYQKLSEIEIIPGVKQMHMGLKLTNKKGFSRNNVVIYKKKKHRGKSYDEPWYILTSLSSVEEVLEVYATRSGTQAAKIVRVEDII